MFTGIIKGIGTVAEIEPVGGDTRLVIDTGDADLGPIALGDSIAVSGVCLTATALDGRRFARSKLARPALSTRVCDWMGS